MFLPDLPAMRPDLRLLQILVALSLALGCLPDASAWGQSKTSNRSQKQRRTRDITPFRKQYSERRSRFEGDLAELAARCETDGLPEAATHVREMARPVSPEEMNIGELPREVRPGLAADLPEEEKQWRKQLRQRQQDYAKELFVLSQKALAAGHASFAYDLVREVAFHDSDNPAVRKVLGFVRLEDEWVSPFEAKMTRERKVWHDQFGWIPKEHVTRYEQGERVYKGRWITAEREAEIRRDFVNAWEVRTEHYLVRTDHSLERGVDLAKKLEDFQGLLKQTLAGFFNTPEQLRQLLAGGANGVPKPPAKPLVVHFYRTRDEYIGYVKRETEQAVEITRGIFFPKTGVAHFFYDPEVTDDSTLYHEATHQMLSGSRPATGEIGVKSDFWVIEGIACYMESFRRSGRHFSVGDLQTPRLLSARDHFVIEKYYVPIETFSSLGMAAYQKSRDIKRNYSQGAALAHFFLHYDDGRYRDAFIEYLSQIYSPTKSVRENPDSLSELTGVDASDLDREYAEFVRGLPAAEVQAASSGGA